MYIGHHAALTPDRAAVIIAETGETITYAEVDANSNRIAQYLHGLGLRRGDAVAILMENHLNYMDVVWACLRSGLYAVCLNRYGTADEVAWILRDSGARVLFASERLRDTAQAVADAVPHRVMVGAPAPGWLSYAELLASHPARRLETEWLGNTMPYTSGTTGRPKGVVRPLPRVTVDQEWPRVPFGRRHFDFAEGMIYYAPAPMYHGAPMQFLRATHCLGGTVVQVQKFDELRMLEHIQLYRITHTQVVPTMFVRLLKLPVESRMRFDLSSLVSVVHSAAPCPREVKQAMIDWLGPIVHEYYGATDAGTMIPIRCADWLTHPGAVGRPEPGTVVVCDEAGAPLAPGEQGLIYFVHQGPPHEYRNDPEKTRAARHPQHPNWTTSGDLGFMDDDGFLYLTDRKAFTIISGGVNIYPQMIEDALITHESVREVAVFGVPNPEMGEEVKAVVELMPGTDPSEALSTRLIDHVRARVAAYMVPRSLDFVAELPRSPTGKLLKQPLRDAYWKQADPDGLPRQRLMT